jgi:preprotein translocase subunit SecE
MDLKPLQEMSAFFSSSKRRLKQTVYPSQFRLFARSFFFSQSSYVFDLLLAWVILDESRD